MFSGQLPQFFDPRKFADQGAEIRGRTTVGALPRLAEYRQSRDEPVEVALRFGHDEDGRRAITGTVSTTLTLTCQRCLEPVDYHLEANIHLVMVWGEEQIKALPEHLEPLLVAEEKMPLADVLEEELLLALPLVAMHEKCPVSLVDEAKQEEAPEDQQRENPFAVLAQLKGRQNNRSE